MKKVVGETSTTYIGSLFEKDSNNTTRKYIYAGANKVATVESSGQTYYSHSDHLGSSNITTDKDGRQVSLSEFTPFGSTFKQQGTYDPKRKFTGKELDASTGLYFYGSRYYDPQLGRFTQADTIIQSPYDPQTLNRYSYCRNNPLKYIDPTGHFFWAAIIGIIKAVAAFAAAHPVIFGAIVGATLNPAVNAGNIHGFGSFMAYAGIGAAGGAIGGGVGGLIGASSPFWGTVGGAFAGGFVSGAGNAGYQGASFGDAMLSGLISGGIAAGTATILYGASKLADKMYMHQQQQAFLKDVNAKLQSGEIDWRDLVSYLNSPSAPAEIKSDLIALMNSSGFNLQEQSPGAWSQTWNQSAVVDAGQAKFGIRGGTTLNVEYLGNNTYGIHANKAIEIFTGTRQAIYNTVGAASRMKVNYEYYNSQWHLTVAESDLRGPLRWIIPDGKEFSL